MLKKQLLVKLIKAQKLAEGEVEGIVATEDIDRQGEKIDIKGLNVKKFMAAGGPVLYGHDYQSLPIGRTQSIRKSAGQLIARFKLATEISMLANQVYNLILGGYLTGLSVGFIGKEFDEENNTWTASEMLEFSVVPVPANSEAMVTAKSKGLETNESEEFSEVTDSQDKNISDKSVIGYKKTPLADKDMAWNGPMQIRECGDDMTKLKAISTWFDSENPDVKSSYKLPHHLAAGSHSVVWNGVKAAMGALLGARGGVDVPSGDRKGIYNHLKSHYGDFDEEAPEFKSIEEIDEDKSIETLSSQISGLQTQMSAMADTIKTAFVTDKRENKGKRKLVLVTTKKHAQIIDKQVELIIVGVNKILSGTDN